MSKSPSHVVVRQKDLGFECLHCGEELVIKMPCAITPYVRAGKSFTRAHKSCPKPEVVES